MNIIKTLTARIEDYRKENKQPCKSYATEGAAEKATATMALKCAMHFAPINMRPEDVRPAPYVVFYNEAWGRWVGCINQSEVLARKESVGGYLGVCTGFFVW